MFTPSQSQDTLRAAGQDLTIKHSGSRALVSNHSRAVSWALNAYNFRTGNWALNAYNSRTVTAAGRV
jgi:hypothetical protein